MRCTTCDLVHVGDDLHTDAAYYDYYERRVDLPEEELYLELTTRRLEAVLADLARTAPGRRLLDVGCGEGQLLRAAHRTGWQATGIDLSPAAVRIGQRFGLDARAVDFFDDALAPGSWDVITMIELLEHVPDPAAFLRRAEELLAPGGVLHLTTPNYASLGRRVLGPDWAVLSPAHLLYLTPATLRRLVADRTGLVVRRLVTRNLSAAAVRRLARRPAPVAAPLPKGTAHVGAGFADEQRLRQTIERSPALRRAKQAANLGLRLTGTGETIAAWLVKPGGPT